MPFAALLFTAAQVTHAEDVTTVTGQAPPVEQVLYQPAELASEAGVRSLRTRVRLASRRVCAPDKYTNMANYRELHCYSPTVKHALAQIDRAVAQNRGRGDSLAGVASITVGVR